MGATFIMPKSNNRPNTKLHCQNCGKKRSMLQFFAINTDQKDKENKVYPFDLKRFLDLIKADTMVKLPKYYCGVCSECLEKTFYRGQNRGKKLDVVVV
jgi:hypothetical protein